jgi:hypothetical protein
MSDIASQEVVASAALLLLPVHRSSLVGDGKSRKGQLVGQKRKSPPPLVRSRSE